MADSHPFANAGLGMFGSDIGYAKQGMSGESGLGQLAAAYLANKAGLIDLNNPGQKRAFEQGGFKGVMAHNIVNRPVVPPLLGGSGAATGSDMDAATAPEGIQPPVQGSSIPPDTQMAYEDIDTHLPQFLSIFGMA